MLGVITNVIAILIGSTIGLSFKRGIPQRLTDAVMLGLGLCTVYIGISGMLKGENTLITIISVALGAIIGTLLDIDGKINRLGNWVSCRFSRSGGQSLVAQGFVTASLLFCIGAMTIVGSLNAGLRGDNELLFTKSLLDFISSIMLSVSFGIGVILSSIFVLVFQGGIVLLSGVLAPLLTDSAIAEMTCAGSVIIFALGLNIVGITKIKVTDYSPAILLAPVLSYIFTAVSSHLG
ncbi:MAG: DUF554 domain-containing protein [Oscillospiraceae bacterium]